VARFFSVHQLGVLATVYLFVILGQLIINRGCDQNIQVLIATNLKNLSPIFLKNITIRRLKNCSFFLLLLLAIYFIDTEFYYCFILGVFIGCISSLSSPYEIYMIIEKDFKKLVIFKFLAAFFSLILTLFFYALQLNDFLLLAILLTSEKILFLFFALFYRNQNLNLDRTILLEPPNNNLAVILSTITVFLYNRSDQLYIAKFLNHAKLGEYFSVLKFFEIANLLVFAFLSSEMHKLTNKNINERVCQIIYRRIFYSTLFLVILLGLSVNVFVPLLFSIKITENFYYSIVICFATIISLIGSIKGPWVAKNNIYLRNTLFTFFGAFSSLLYLYIFKPQTLLLVSLALFLGQFVTNILLPLFYQEERNFLKAFFVRT
jgi:O-antigen/teichoic acid export membrane protein